MYAEPVSRAIENRAALVAVIDDQEHAVEKLQATVGDLMSRLELVRRPSEPSPDLNAVAEVMPNCSPASERLRAVAGHIRRIQQMVNHLMDSLDL
jgi:hypothetical protein